MLWNGVDEFRLAPVEPAEGEDCGAGEGGPLWRWLPLGAGTGI